ncbi:MAG TPA: hypothetical protein VK934_09510 [Fimbriimonas sp.]|nr:hypothetical protein [Fimbriimonas sp.]
MDLDFLLNQVKGAIFRDPTTPHQEGNDPSGLIGQIEELFGRFRGQQQEQRRVLPASQDPYGDPADLHPASGYGGNYGQQEYPNVRPASEDPLGDPADQQFRNVKPASEDPLGDPADLEPGRRY